MNLVIRVVLVRVLVHVVLMLYARSAVVERNLEVHFVNALGSVAISDLTYPVELVSEFFHGRVKFGKIWQALSWADVF